MAYQRWELARDGLRSRVPRRPGGRKNGNGAHPQCLRGGRVTPAGVPRSFSREAAIADAVETADADTTHQRTPTSPTELQGS